METTKYVRKPFYVEAVQVTQANLVEAADWCGGRIVQEEPKLGNDGTVVEPWHIVVPVRHPLNKAQTLAYPGHWILKANGGFKVYLPGPFDRNFDLVTDNGVPGTE